MTDKRIYVIGHRNPDTDSVAAAIGYAELKRALGDSRVQAAAAGALNPQARYILQRLGVDAPLTLTDVFPRVRDVLRGEVITATATTPLRDGLELLHRHGVRALPVVDGDGRPLGLVSLLKLSEQYLGAAAGGLRAIETTEQALAQTLAAVPLDGEASGRLMTFHLFVGAMSEGSFLVRIAGYAPESLLVITGDRPEIQELAVSRGVGVLVITGGGKVDDAVRARARASGVTILTTPHDTATAAWLARLSTPLQVFADVDFVRVQLDESLDALRLKLLHAGVSAVLAVDADGCLAGIATKSSLLAPIPYALILVDHNELAQAVRGAEAVEIIEVIDHHKLGNKPTSQPMAFSVAPVGSTSTLVAARYREYNVPPRPAIAALLLAGILSDTVILKSPTTTAVDVELATWLAGLCELDPTTFGREIFSACSGFSAHGSPSAALRADFKHFTAGDLRFGVGQVEVTGFAEFERLGDELRQVLLQLRGEDRLHLAALMVTDIYTETTLLLTTPLAGLALVIGYPEVAADCYELRGVMSRKKQLVPLLLKALGQLGSPRPPS